MRAGARISQRDVFVDASERHAAAPDAEQAHFHLKRIAGTSNRSLDDRVGAKLAPAIERNRVGRGDLFDGLVRVARNHVELALEREIVPEHLGDDPRSLGRFLVRRQRDEIGDGVMQGRADVPGDRDADFRLAWRWSRLLRWRRGLRRDHGKSADVSRSDKKMLTRILHGSVLYFVRTRNSRCTVKCGSGNAAGSGASIRVLTRAR